MVVVNFFLSRKSFYAPFTWSELSNLSLLITNYTQQLWRLDYICLPFSIQWKLSIQMHFIRVLIQNYPQLCFPDGTYITVNSGSTYCSNKCIVTFSKRKYLGMWDFPLSIIKYGWGKVDIQNFDNRNNLM